MLVILFYVFMSGVVTYTFKGYDRDGTWYENLAGIVLSFLVGWLTLPLDLYADLEEIKIKLRNLDK